MALLVAAVVGCSAPPAAAPSGTASPVVAASGTASPTATAAAVTPVPLATSTASVWALACGTVSDLVSTTTTANGSLVLNSPGRAPLTITLTPPRWNPEARVAGYICALLDAGVPRPIFAGLSVPGTAEAYAEPGTYPATRAKPSPTGFVLPQTCAFIRPPEVGPDQTSWSVDCGAQLNNNARGTIGAALMQQGWTACGPATATETYYTGAMRIVVVESSLAPGDYPRFAERPGTGCG